MAFPHTVYLAENDIKVTSSTQRFPLGTRGVTVDGRVFRYAQNGAVALVAHRLVANAIEGPWTTGTYTHFANVPGTSGGFAAGTTQVYIGDTATGSATANYYKDGWLIVNSTDTSYTQMVRINSHAAISSATQASSPGVIINLDPGTGLNKAGVTDTGLVKLVANPYRAVVVAIGGTAVGLTNVPLGIPPVAVTASYYFWLQTWGPALGRTGSGGLGISADRSGMQVWMSTGDTGAFGGGTTSNVYTDTSTAAGQFFMAPIGSVATAAPAENFYTVVNLNLAP
jgi:hypothetical protein